MSEVDPLDLSNLQMLPDWVKQPQEKPKFKEESVRPPGGGKGRGQGGFGGGDRRGGGGGDRRGGPPQGRRDDNRGGPGGGGGRRDGDQRSGQGRGQGQGQRRDGGRGGQGGQGGRGGQRRDFQDRDRRPQQDPLPKDVSLSFQPAREGVAFIAQQIKTSGCAYPVFDLARLILNNRDRYSLIIESKGDAKLHLCKLDNSLWLTREQAVAHATTCDEFGDYYKEEQVTVDPPKGNFSSIAVCGLSGKFLGPPNHHSYQENIVRIHAEQFSRMHIDGYKRKIKMERGEEIVEKWKEQESTQTQFTLLKTEEGDEPVVLKSRQEAIRHFSQHFAASMVQEVKKATLPGDITGRQLAPGLFNLLRQEGERLRKFPMDLVQRLCRAFEKQGLKFFKEGKKTTYVARIRPHQIQNEEKFSDGIRKIVSYVRAHPNTKLNDLAGALIPESKRSTAAPAPKKKKSRRRSGRRKPRPTTRAFTIWILPHRKRPQPIESPPVEAKKAAPRSQAFTIWTRPSHKPSENAVPSQPPAQPTPQPSVAKTAAFTIWTLPHLPKPVAPANAGQKKPAAPALTPEEIAVLQDLRWLIREGYVIEFSNGTLKLPREHEVQKKRTPKKKAARPAPDNPTAASKAETDSPAPTAGPDASAYPKPNCTPTSPPPTATKTE